MTVFEIRETFADLQRLSGPIIGYRQWTLRVCIDIVSVWDYSFNDAWFVTCNSVFFFLA